MFTNEIHDCVQALIVDGDKGSVDAIIDGWQVGARLMRVREVVDGPSLVTAGLGNNTDQRAD